MKSIPRRHLERGCWTSRRFCCRRGTFPAVRRPPDKRLWLPTSWSVRRGRDFSGWRDGLRRRFETNIVGEERRGERLGAKIL